MAASGPLRWFRHPDPLRDRVLLYCAIRTGLVIYFLLFGTLAVNAMIRAGAVSEATGTSFTRHYRVVDLLYLAIILLQTMAVRRGQFEKPAMFFSIFGDIAAITWIFAHWVGSLTNLLVSFYLFLPIVYRLIYTRRVSYTATLAMAAAYFGIAFAEHLGILPYGPLRSQSPPLEISHAALFYPTVSYLLIALAVTAILFNASMDRFDESQKRLAQADGLAAIAQLANGASHELGNPLGSARSLIESAREDLAGMRGNGQVEDARRAMEMATSSIDRAREVLARLSEFSNQSLARTDLISLNEVVREAWERLAQAWKRDLPSVRWHLGENLPPVRGNMLQVRQAIGQIQMNALQSVAGLDGGLSFETGTEDGRVAFHCYDQGTGIREDLLAQVRHPFVTTRRAEGALGLGLYVVEQVANQHGGLLIIEPAKGRGTHVALEFPAEA